MVAPFESFEELLYVAPILGLMYGVNDLESRPLGEEEPQAIAAAPQEECPASFSDTPPDQLPSGGVGTSPPERREAMVDGFLPIIKRGMIDVFPNVSPKDLLSLHQKDERIARVVKEIFSGVFEKVFSEPFMSSPWRSRDIFSSKKDQIFKACVKAVAGKGCWNAIFEIAKVCASEMSVQTIRKIRKFYLQDEYMLIKIAEICARRAGKTMAKNLRSFGIQSQAAQDRIFQMCTEKKQLQ